MRPNNRLEGDRPAEFCAPVIDRTRPIRFRLNGRDIVGFEGDSVLSAAIASGVASVGIAGGSALALDAASAPSVVVAGNAGRPDLAMPMDICPAIDGVSLITLSPAPHARPSVVSKVLARRASGLGLAYATTEPAPGGWIDAEATRAMTSDVAVVGGGIAGLAAALAAAKNGKRVCIIESEPVLGGLSVMFGRAEGEPAPDELIATLASEIGSSGLITVLLGTRAFALDGTRVRAVRVTSTGGLPAPEHIAVSATEVVLATGVEGGLPIFPGNRLPGVVEASAAWRLAARYNVWPGQSAHIHTGTNVGYRMALLGAASGKAIARTTDPRRAPQTRFIEFCKAYGYRLGWGYAIAAVTPERGKRLGLALVDSDTGKPYEDAQCNRLIVSGGWQPALDLWVRAGGAVQWDAHHEQFYAQGTLEGVAIAGSAAGYLSLAGCRDHGTAIGAALPRTAAIAVADPQIDPIFETPDGPISVHGPTESGQAPGWVSPRRVTAMPEPQKTGFGRLFDRRDAAPPIAARALDLSDVAGLIAADRLAATDAESFCAERCVLPLLLSAPSDRTAPHEARADALPGYLVQRFGLFQSRWRLVLASSRHFEPGSLIYVNTDDRSPLTAVGVVLTGSGSGVDALISGDSLEPGDTIYIRDGNTAIAARLDARL